jgi:hypothetical protein
MILKFINIIMARHMATDSYVKANRVGFSCVLKKLCHDHDLIMVANSFLNITLLPWDSVRHRF